MLFFTYCGSSLSLLENTYMFLQKHLDIFPRRRTCFLKEAF